MVTRCFLSYSIVGRESIVWVRDKGGAVDWMPTLFHLRLPDGELVRYGAGSGAGVSKSLLASLLKKRVLVEL